MADYLIHLSIVLTVIVLLIVLLRGNANRFDNGTNGKENLNIKEEKEMSGFL